MGHAAASVIGRRRNLAAIGLIVLVAAGLRVPSLGGLDGTGLPPGLHVDEAYNILDAREVLAGWRPVFLPANAGRDVAYTYWQAGLFAVLGESRAVARAASAVLGVLTILCTWGYSRTLPIPRPERVALVTAGLTAVSFWHIHFSRFGIRAVAFPLVVTLVIWSWSSALDRLGRSSTPFAATVRQAWPQLALLSVTLGLAAYTHPAGRGLVLVPALHAVYRSTRTRDVRPLFLLSISAGGALVVALPLVVFWLEHPWLFTGHAEEVSILGQGLGAVAANCAKVAAMFNLAGDPAPWRNQPGRPVFDAPTGLLYLAGLAMALRAFLQDRDWAVLPLIWLVVLSLPTVLTDAAPNFSRAIGVIPVVFLFPALALDALSIWLQRRFGDVAAALVVVGWLSVSGAWAVRDYWGWSRDDATHMAFDDEKVALAQLVNRRGDAGWGTYVSEFMAQHPTVRVVAESMPAGFYPAYGLVLPPKSRAAYAFLDYETDAIAELERRLEAHGARVEPVEIGTDGHGRLHDLVAFETEADRLKTRLANAGDRTVAFSSSIRLVGVELPPRARAGEVMTATLVWESLEPTATDMNTALHLVSTRDETVAQGDGPPVGGTYTTDQWRHGELVVSDHAIDLPADAPPGHLEVRVGWYDWRTARAMTTPDGDTVAAVGSVRVYR